MGSLLCHLCLEQCLVPSGYLICIYLMSKCVPVGMSERQVWGCGWDSIKTLSYFRKRIGTESGGDHTEEKADVFLPFCSFP